MPGFSPLVEDDFGENFGQKIHLVLSKLCPHVVHIFFVSLIQFWLYFDTLGICNFVVKACDCCNVLVILRLKILSYMVWMILLYFLVKVHIILAML